MFDVLNNVAPDFATTLPRLRRNIGAQPFAARKHIYGVYRQAKGWPPETFLARNQGTNMGKKTVDEMVDIGSAEFSVFSVKATDVLDVFPHRSHGRLQRPSNNLMAWAVRAKRQASLATIGGPEWFRGAGLYGLFYKGSLIYIGKFLGQKNNPWAGNIVVNRWWAHIATVTAFGHRISFSPSIWQQLQDESPNHPLIIALGKVVRQQVFATDRGGATSLKRLMFARKHWDTFGHGQPENILRDFCFVYVRATGNGAGNDIEGIRQAISSAEQDAVVEFSPCCNRGGADRPKGNPNPKALARYFVSKLSVRRPPQ